MRARIGLVLLAVGLTMACRQPQETTEQDAVPTGAVPAAPDMRPETGPEAGGVVLPGTEPGGPDTVSGGATPPPTDTLPGQAGPPR